MNTKIGLLLPKSVIYPSINFDLMAGLRAGLSHAGITDIEIKTESIGIAGNDKQIYGQCEKLLMEGINIVVGYVNPSTAQKLSSLCSIGNAIFIALDAGYHLPASIEKQANVFYISLQGALGCRVVTKMAIDGGVRKVAYTGSYYEAGYRSAYACAKCLDDVGGEITMNHITALARAEFSLAPLTAHLSTGEPDAVFAAFCGDMLQDFYTAAANDNVFANHPVYGAPFMAEEQWLDQSVYPGTDIKVCVPWGRELDTEGNRIFTSVLNEAKQRVNVFSLLGWEAGTVVAEALAVNDLNAAITRLEGFSFIGPRGKVTLDAVSHQCIAPVYEAKVQKNEVTGNCLLKITQESAQTEEQRTLLIEDILAAKGSFTSWLNAYACLDS